MKYKALALDLDGTLTDSNKKVSQKNIEAVHKAIDKGVAVILASGRAMLGIHHIVKELELEQRGGYILACNGGIIIDCKTGNMLYQRIMPKECIHSICELSKQNQVVALTYYEEKIVSENDDDFYIIKEMESVGAPVHKVDSLEDFVNYPVEKFLVVGEHEKLLPVQESLLEQYAGKIDVFFSESYFLEVVPFGVSKGAALDILMQHMGLRREQLMACGDGMNDISMLKYAGMGIVMENAYPQVLRYADAVTLSNDEDGVAAAIEEYILKEC